MSRSQVFPGGVRVVVEGVVNVFVFINVWSLRIGWPLVDPEPVGKRGTVVTLISVRVGWSVAVLESVRVCRSVIMVVSVNKVFVFIQIVEGLLVQGLSHVLQGDGGEVRGSVRGLEAAELVSREGGVSGLLVDGLHQTAPDQLEPYSVVLRVRQFNNLIFVSTDHLF